MNFSPQLKRKPLTVVMISTDPGILEDGSTVQLRMKEYGTLFTELHIVLFTKAIRNPHAPKVLQVGTNVLVYPTMSLNRWFCVWDAIRIGKKLLTRLCARVGKDALVITTQDPFETGLVGRKLKRLFGVRLNVQIHTDFLNPYFTKVSWLNRVRCFIADRVLPAADSVRAVSTRIADQVSKKYALPREKMTILPIFTGRTALSADPAALAKSKYPQFTFVMLMVCRLAKEKQILLAMKACAELSKKYPKIGLVIVGDGAERRYLELQAGRLGIANQVIFEGWQADPRPFYTNAHAFLSPSLYEGYGMAMIEAASAGLPVVASDAGIVGDILIDEKNALVCQPSDLACFVSKIARLIEQPDLRERMRLANMDLVMPSVHASKEAYLAAYQKSLE